MTVELRFAQYGKRRMESEIVYTPESALRRPVQLLREMKCDLLASREVGWR